MTKSSSINGAAGALFVLLVCAAEARAQTPSASAQTLPVSAALADAPLIGERNRLLYIRDPRDFVRLFPHGELNLDFHGFAGKQVRSLQPSEAGVDLGPRIFVRRARLELAGELFKRISFDLSLDITTQPAVDGALAARKPTRAALADAWLFFGGSRARLMLGVFQAPFSLENRTARRDLAMLERNLAVRGLAIPGGKVLGIAAGGSMRLRVLSWDIGLFGAERLAPGRFERGLSSMGRLTSRPFARRAKNRAREAQIGVSARLGMRNLRDARADTPALTTGQGFALWRPTYVDGLGQTLHVVSSGMQGAVGGELRVPFKCGVVRSEAYWVSRETSEYVESFEPGRSERTGTLRGVTGYLELSVWPLAGSIESQPPIMGEHPHGEHLELAALDGTNDRYGLEFALMAAGIHARYDGASKAGRPGLPAADLNVVQIGLAANWWHTRRFRLSFNPNLYWAPKSGSARNVVVVPGNLGARNVATHYVVELGGRAAFMF